MVWPVSPLLPISLESHSCVRLTRRRATQRRPTDKSRDGISSRMGFSSHSSRCRPWPSSILAALTVDAVQECRKVPAPSGKSTGCATGAQQTGERLSGRSSGAEEILQPGDCDLAGVGTRETERPWVLSTFSKVSGVSGPRACLYLAPRFPCLVDVLCSSMRVLGDKLVPPDARLRRAEHSVPLVSARRLWVVRAGGP